MANKNLFKAPFLRAELRMPDSNLLEPGIEWRWRGQRTRRRWRGERRRGWAAVAVVVAAGCMEI